MSDNATSIMQGIAIGLVILCIAAAWFLGEKSNPKGKDKGRN